MGRTEWFFLSIVGIGAFVYLCVVVVAVISGHYRNKAEARAQRDQFYPAFKKAWREGYCFMDLFTDRDVRIAAKDMVLVIDESDEVRIIAIIRQNFSKQEGINFAVIQRAIKQWQHEKTTKTR